MRIFAKSIRKLASKLKGYLEIGKIAKISFVKRTGFKEYLLIGAETVFEPSYLQLNKNNFKFLNQAFFVFDKFTELEHEEPEKIKQFYFNLTNYLKYLFKSQNQKKILLNHISFVIKILALSGLKPDLKNCIVCSKKFNKQQIIYYDISNGGLVCCFRTKLVYDIDNLKLLNFLLLNNFQKINQLNIEKKIIIQTWNLILNHLKYCL
jgi:DNA repair protein RecO